MRMKFSEDFGDARYRIVAYGKDWVQVNEQRLEQAFIVSPQHLHTDWQAGSLAQLQAETLQALLELPAEVFIIASNETNRIPNKAIHQALVASQTGFEIMTIDAACRTYNVLLSESRNVAMAVLFGATTPR